MEVSTPAPGVLFIRRATEPPAPDAWTAARRDRQRRIARITGPLTPDPDADLARGATEAPAPADNYPGMDCPRECYCCTWPEGDDDVD
ncbi:hypothetical protein [Streptomyces collinus]|uniref:hypothetical protein n=1 Tax=Streptomyces collinus TaxID=42684 RepID=UPI0011DCF224|nr:hypothetical protein [Streptomyces collinus]